MAIVNKHQNGIEPIVSQHLRLIRAYPVNLPGCNFCLFNIPIHKFTCGHSICDFCVRLFLRGRFCAPERSTKICFLCGMENTNAVILKPPDARVRVLLLSGGPDAVVKFLFEVRSCLFGPMSEYLDLVVASQSSKHSGRWMTSQF